MKTAPGCPADVLSYSRTVPREAYASGGNNHGPHWAVAQDASRSVANAMHGDPAPIRQNPQTSESCSQPSGVAQR